MEYNAKKLSSLGEILLDTYDHEVGNEEAIDVLVRDDGKIVVTGKSEAHVLGGASSSIFINVYDTSLTRISRKLIGGNNSGHNCGESISKTSDNGFVISGYSTILNRGESGNVYYCKKRFLGKTDAEGNGNALYISKRTVNFGEVFYGETRTDTISIKNNWLYDIHVSTSLQNHFPEVFFLPEGEAENDTLVINANDSLRAVIRYAPTSSGSGGQDSALLLVLWDKIENSFNYTDSVILLGKGENPDEVSDTDNPTEFSLMQNYPNPFNPTTTIRYSIPANVGVETHGRVSLRIYNILGEEIATLVNQRQAPGIYSVHFNASNLPSGIYFYTLRVGNFVATKKMVLLK